MNNQLRTDLERAAQAVEERGHCQGEFMSLSGRICTMQALAFGAEIGDLRRSTHDNSPRFQALRNTVQQEIGRGVSICDWNNRPGRTGRDVATMLRKVAQTAPGAAPAPMAPPMPTRSRVVGKELEVVFLDDVVLETASNMRSFWIKELAKIDTRAFLRSQLNVYEYA